LKIFEKNLNIDFGVESLECFSFDFGVQRFGFGVRGFRFLKKKRKPRKRFSFDFGVQRFGVHLL
jgi:hypothetical protein